MLRHHNIRHYGIFSIWAEQLLQIRKFKAFGTFAHLARLPSFSKGIILYATLFITQTMGNIELQYVPLDSSTCSIRLLRFLPNPDLFDCVLETHEMNKCPPYRALSYVWGTDEPTHQIRLNNSAFFVRDNLWHALSKLSSLDRGNKQQLRYFWIDAVCINQNDLLERGHQVDLMGLIFSEARITIVWLGPAEDESDFAMESLETDLHALNEEDVALFDQNGLRHNMNRTIESLLSRDYFSRMWVVQEVLLARDILILCGSKCRIWHDLSRYAKGNLTLEHPFKPSIPNAAQAIITARDNLMFKMNPRHSLDTFLMRFGAGKCSDIRDRVYGLLGLIRATNQHSTIPQADYTISAVQVYCRTMEFIQREQRQLPHGPSYFEEVSTVLANALELPRHIHQSISVISTVVFHFQYEIKGSGHCAFSELLHRCILPLEAVCDIKLTSPFDYDTKYKEVTRKFDFFPIDENPKMWSEFEETLGSLLRIWGSYIRLDPGMEHIPFHLRLPIDKRLYGKIWAICQSLSRNIQLLIGRAVPLKKLQ
ncbi:heterokaryon incompatibility protein-domain-containing protein, partial [Hypoxylon cercidicola]